MQNNGRTNMHFATASRSVSQREYSHNCIQVDQSNLKKLLVKISMKTGFFATLSC